MRRRVRREAASRLRELARTRDVATGDACVVPGDGDVHEPLEEVALNGVGCTPRLFESLVGRVEVARADRRQPALVGFGDVFGGHVRDGSDA